MKEELKRKHDERLAELLALKDKHEFKPTPDLSSKSMQATSAIFLVLAAIFLTKAAVNSSRKSSSDKTEQSAKGEHTSKLLRDRASNSSTIERQ